MPDRRPGDRYEPLPPFHRVPGVLWSRMGTAARSLVVVAGVAVVVAVAILAPRIADIRKDNTANDKAERARALKANRARIIELQRPRRVTGPAERSAAPAGERIASRTLLVAAMRRAVVRDSDSRRGATRARRADCARAPGPDPTRDLVTRSGRYGCTAVTSDVKNANVNGRGTIGYYYRVELNFGLGRITMCQVAGVAAEGSLVRDARVRVSRSCGS